MLALLTVAGIAAPVGFTGYRIFGRVRRFAADRAQMWELREFVDSFSRELSVGTVAVVAAGHALDAFGEPQRGRRTRGREELRDRVRLEIYRVMLGAVPGASLEIVTGGAMGGTVGSEGGCDLEGVGATGGLQCSGGKWRVKMGGNPGKPRGDRNGTAAGVGGTELTRVLAVWASAQRYGIALGRLMEQTRVDLDARLQHLGHTSSALAGARLTETILLLLPMGAVGIGQSMGVDPGAFLFGNILGALLLMVGVLLGCAGALWTESLTVAVLGGVGRRAGPSPLDAARVLDLFAESLRAGLPLAMAWDAAARCGREDAEGGGGEGPGTGSGWRRRRRQWSATQGAPSDLVHMVSALLALGAGAAAWEPLSGHPEFGPVARLVESGVRNGVRLAEGVHAHAVRLRQEAADMSLARAEQVLVVVAAPLTLCFLPAFVLVGLIPLVVGFAGI